MKKWPMIAAALVFLLSGGVYFGSPYYAAHSLRNAALEADTDRLEAAIDFPSVRESMKQQLAASFMSYMQNDPDMRDNPFAGLGAIMAPALIDTAVESFVTPDGIAALLRGQKPAESVGTEWNPEIETNSEYIGLDRFRVRLQNTKLDEEGPSFLFERRGFASWKLIKVELPSSLLSAKSDEPNSVPNEGLAFSEDRLVPTRGSCDSTSLAIDLGVEPQGGAVEIMTPLADTDGKRPYRVIAERIVCISPSIIANWTQQAGQIESGLSWEVTYDPSGTPQDMRSQFDYSVLMCEELLDKPQAPADLLLGHFEWSPDMGVSAVQVTWERNFRGYLERTCF